MLQHFSSSSMTKGWENVDTICSFGGPFVCSKIFVGWREKIKVMRLQSNPFEGVGNLDDPSMPSMPSECMDDVRVHPIIMFPGSFK